MILTRNNFKNIKDIVANELCCTIPIGTKQETITEIADDTFLDWKNLQYVYIPSSISKVSSKAFNWDNIKIIFANTSTTKFENISDHVKVLNITGNEAALFEMLSIVMNFKKALEFNPDSIVKTDKKLSDLTNSFIEMTTEKEQKIKEKEDNLKTLYQKLDEYQSDVEEIANNVLKNLDEVISKRLTTDAKKYNKDLLNTYSNIKKEVEKLNGIIKSCHDTKAIMENVEKEISKNLDKKKQEITRKFDELSEELNQIYNNSKTDIIEKIVSEAEEILIKKNPCKNIIINIPDCKKKFEGKDLFHKNFETVLKLVALKKPVLLKGPAGSGKNVIVEQVAKALDLQFYYLNDVTEEYKVMGFVDANGRYVETQFFKAFTNGGLMFVDEIDNSHPSALLSINAAIGTGYNHYMAFPDGNFYKASPNFHLVAAANTFGTGSDAIYCGRQALDGASLNRLLPVTIDYDRNLEKSLVSNTDILNLYWNVRDIIQNNTIRHIISTRNIKNASDLIDANIFDLGDIFDWTIVGGMDKNDLNIIAGRLDENDSYSRKFKNHLVRKYGVSSRM